MFTEPGTAREEAERLIAAALAAATLAANANPHWSTGSAECCVCPLCKVIAAVRDPDPEFVERLATGAGDLAAGLTSFLRNIAPPERTADPWHEATREPAEPQPSAQRRPSAQTRPADRPDLPAQSDSPADPAEQAGTPPAEPTRPPVKPMAKKVAKKAVKKAVRPTVGQQPVNTVFQEPTSESGLDL